MSHHKGSEVSQAIDRYCDCTMFDGIKDRMMTAGEKRGPHDRTGMSGHL